MKRFIIMSMTVDGATCDDDGFTNCANFDLVGTRACETLEEAIEVRDQTIETDLADFQGLWVEEEGYSYDTGKLGDDPMSDVYIDVYYNGEVINETIYKIREIEC